MSRASRKRRREAERASRGRQETDAGRETAVPVTAGELELLAAALAEAQRYTIATGAMEGTRDRLLKSAGTAVARGHETVPVPVSDLRWLDEARRQLLRSAPRDAITRKLAALYDQLTVRGGLACQHRWTARHGPWGLRWDTEPQPGNPGPGRQPELEAR